MKHKQDIFSLIPRLDGFASHYDWQNHCIGTTTLMQGINAVLRPTGQMAQSVSYPDVLSRSLSVLDEEEDGRYLAYEEDGCSLIPLTWQDVQLWELNLPAFAVWVQKLLKIPANIKPKFHQSNKLIEWAIKEERVFLSLSSSGADIVRDVTYVDSGSPATLLFLDDGWTQSSVLFAEVSKHTRIMAFSIQKLIRPMGDGYEYYHEIPFAELILQHEPVLPEAQFLARPAGCSWEHLHIQIRTDSRYEVLAAGKDVIIAWYENELGHLIGKKKSIMLERLPKFCRNGKGTQIYALLKSFAAHGGRDDASQYPNKNLANQVRKNLREYLCILFGYSHSESPIEQESKNIYRVAFSISFSTGHVDETNSRYVAYF